MNRYSLLKKWLGDRRRSYADGVSLFRSLARPQIRERFGKYIDDGIGKAMDQFDGRFTFLVNQLTRISHDIRLQPTLYPAAFEECAAVVTTDGKVSAQGSESSDDGTSDMEDTVADLENRVLDQEDAVSELEETVRQHDEDISDLQEKVDDLSMPGVKVVTEASMPPSIRKYYDRIKEIVPLYSRLHADISHEDITDDERKKLADQLCDLDDERRRLWSKIDAWAEGRKVDVEVERPQYSDDPVVRGYEYARAVKRLKENIRNSQRAADKAKEDGRIVVYDNAMRRIEGYMQELKDIESEMSGS